MSEPGTIRAFARALPLVRLLDTHSDPDHGRSVFTLAAGQGDLAVGPHVGCPGGPRGDRPARTIFEDPGEESFFDQVAWFGEEGKSQLTLGYTGRAGRFEWTRYLLQGLEAVEKPWRISDHYPLWAEFSVAER